MKEKKIPVGALVQSIAGHDAGDFFLVVRQEDNFVWVCNGKQRKANHCKQKNLKHITETGLVCDWVETHPEQINNTSVKKAIKEMLRDSQMANRR